jgi:hypothetical protein
MVPEMPGGLEEPAESPHTVTPLPVTLGATLTTTGTNLESLRTQSEDRVSALATKKKELSELIAAGELSKSWSTIETQVRNAKEAVPTERPARRPHEPTASNVRVPGMRMILRCLLVGVLVAGVVAGCGNQSGGGGGKPNPGSSSSQGGGGY